MKAWTVIQNKTEYDAVIKRIEDLSKNPPEKKSDEGRELLLLGFLADSYEEERFPFNYPDPIDAIKVRMENLTLSISDMLDIFGDRGTASKILNRKRSLSLNMIRQLSQKLSLPEALLIQPVSKSTEGKKRTTMVQEPKPAYKKKPGNRKKKKSY
ncbi:MAG: transcriptional regulator [Cyclobacteriaceae bacterium]